MVKADIRIKFGNRIRTLRLNNKYTQTELAKRAGISLSYVQMLEATNPKKRKNVTIVAIEKISNAFDMSPSELLDF